MPTQEQLEAAVVAACKRLKDKERSLFERNINERTLTHKFAMYLQEQVDSWDENWDVDCEFNRDTDFTGENYIKKLDLSGTQVLHPTIYDEEAATVFPDVIIHHRGGDNLLVVEIKKKSATAQSKEFDRKDKLPAYVKQLGYRAAVFVVLDMNKVDYGIEWIQQLK